jgi:oxygen-independent coproporphyrinogen-3 oxidase
MAHAAGFDNVSVDLIYGAPNQTLSQWLDTLVSVLSWKPDHISLYSLSLEEGTTLTRQVRDGVLPQPDSDLAADMYDLCREKLAEQGFIHYEISNWALPHKECRHNIQYWVNKPFLGFGAGAHGYAAGVRYWNVKPIPTYIERVTGKNISQQTKFIALDGMDSIDRESEMSDTVILGLRLLVQGLDAGDFENRFGESLMGAYGDVIAPLIDAGFLEWQGNRLLLAPRAYLVSNQIFNRFIPDEPFVA